MVAEIYEGPITMTRKGLGFFAVEGQEKDLLIPAEWAGHALSGDIRKSPPLVQYKTSKPAGRPAGKVVEIISRARRRLWGLS